VQGEAHVSCGDGQNSHTALGRVLELFTQLLSLRRWSGPINTDKADTLLGEMVADFQPFSKTNMLKTILLGRESRANQSIFL